jgi:carboxyl-terminal processing protease
MKLLQALRSIRRAASLRLLLCAVPLALASCGGGSDRGAPLSCSVTDQKIWLRDYMNDAYFWYRSAPDPDPEGGDTLAQYFDARLFKGDSTFPADRWSYFQPTADFNLFFGDGKTLGYGVSVAGLEVEGQPDMPLMVRYVAPDSPAERAGVVRGDQILSINGTPASELIAAADFSLLSPQASGDRLVLELLDGPASISVTLSAEVYDITPVENAQVVQSAGGRRLGYVFVNNMISQALDPLNAAFQQFKDAGVQDLVLDMRYNGGGLVDVAKALASYVSGRLTAGQPFAKLLYSDRLSDNNQTFEFSEYNNSLSLDRVFVLAGPRTCSASELVANGLRPFIDVVLVGDATCGKPFGFLPQGDGDCGNTYSVVNFESVNADNEGRYVDGLAPTCNAIDDTSRPIGDVEDSLLVTAASYADNGVCPATGAVRDAPKAATPRPKAKRLIEPGQRPAMIPR